MQNFQGKRVSKAGGKTRRSACGTSKKCEYYQLFTTIWTWTIQANASLTYLAISKEFNGLLPSPAVKEEEDLFWDARRSEWSDKIFRISSKSTKMFV